MKTGPQKYIKFIGRFTDLIPNGWKFQKLFARNYRQYHKTCDGKKYSQGCRIWQHLGGYLEIDRFDGRFDYLIVQKIIDGTIDELSSIKKKSPFRSADEKVFWLILDTQTATIHGCDSPEYIAIMTQKHKLHVADAFNEDVVKAFYERYIEINLATELIEMLRDLVNKGWITVCEDKRSC